MAEKKSALSPDRPTHSGQSWQASRKRDAISEEGRRWQEENAEAIKQWNEWVEKNGLPLARYRQF